MDASCHCISVQKSPAEISAHGSGAVELLFNSSHSDGSVAQSVVVETTDGQILAAQFSATVESMAAIAPWIPDRGDGTYQILSQWTGTVLQSATNSASPVQTASYLVHDDQKWIISPAGGGFYNIRSD